jgi:tetrapyrrole methylase family protein/MazG family protein
MLKLKDEAEVFGGILVDKNDHVGLSGLVEMMSRLRAPDGCPWDREQTPESLRPYIIEEAHEVLEAIESGKAENVCEELGDLLFQIIFQARIFSEQGDFDIEDVIDKIHEKMLRRHPHVFGDAKVKDADEVRKNWVEIKREKEGKVSDSALGHVPVSLPALLRARRITENAAEVGFDWERIEDVMAKVEEEWEELKEAIPQGDKKKTDHELGDIIFALVNLGRFLKINPEDSLTRTIGRFEKRFKYIEDSLKKQGKKFEDVTLKDMDVLWDEAKGKGY